jgi:hypothetical protein
MVQYCVLLLFYCAVYVVGIAIFEELSLSSEKIQRDRRDMSRRSRRCWMWVLFLSKRVRHKTCFRIWKNFWKNFSRSVSCTKNGVIWLAETVFWKPRRSRRCWMWVLFLSKRVRHKTCFRIWKNLWKNFWRSVSCTKNGVIWLAETVYWKPYQKFFCIAIDYPYGSSHRNKWHESHGRKWLLKWDVGDTVMMEG